MKLSLAILSLLAATPALADPCQKFMVCGTYEGVGADYDGEGKTNFEFTEKWVISKVNENTLRIQQNMVYNDESREKFYEVDVKVVFAEDGTYTIKRENGSLFAIGACRELGCTFNFMPRKVTHEGKEYTILNVNTFRFSQGKLQRWMMVTVEAGKAELQTANLTKKD